MSETLLPPRSVTCAWCGNRYCSSVPTELDEGLQGSHCASRVVQEEGTWSVHGGYGSHAHDMKGYEFITNAPTVEANPVCDECISERLDRGDLRDLGLESDKRPDTFQLRPEGTWQLVDTISHLVQDKTAMQTLLDGIYTQHIQQHPPESEITLTCELCASLHTYRKWQHWFGTREYEGEEFEKGCPEVAENYRAAAQQLEKLAAFWEGSKARQNVYPGSP